MPLEANAAAAAFKKLMGVGASMLGRGFRSSKCKTESKLATARIKLLRNRREAQIRQMSRDVAMLLQSGQDSTARIRVEHVIREQNILAANEIIEVFCELVVVRLSIIAKQRDCPADLREGISSLIFAAPRCSEIPELKRIRDIFEKKYGKDFVAAATELRPNSGVNRLLIEKLSVRTPLGEVKLKLMKEIAKEYQVEWDTTESEKELLKPLDENLNGPRTFTSAASMPVKSTVPQKDGSLNQPEWRSYSDKEDGNRHLKATISAAQAAAELAEKAVAVAQAAAHLARQTPCQVEQKPSFTSTESYHERSSTRKIDDVLRTSVDSIGQSHSTLSNRSITSKLPEQNCNTDSFGGVSIDQDMKPVQMEDRRISCRMGSYNARVRDSDIKFDDSDGLESDCDGEPTNTYDEGESHPHPSRPPPRHSSHPSDLDDRRGVDHCDIYTSDPNSWVRPMRPDHEEVHFPPPSQPPLALSSSFASDLDDRSSADDSGVYKPDQTFRVHPKLPDYEKLAARFEALKLRRFS